MVSKQFAVSENVKLASLMLGASDGEAVTLHSYNPTAVLSLMRMLPPLVEIVCGPQFFVESDRFKHVKLQFIVDYVQLGSRLYVGIPKATAAVAIS